MEDETDPKTSVRRVGTADRKSALPPAGPLFEDAAGQTPTPPPPSQARRPASTPRPQPKPKRRAKNAALYNLIALLFLLLTVGAVLYFAFLWENFRSPLNPFAPPTPLPIIVTATPGG